jgi:uncharacterized protein with HEPN domain
MSSERIGDWLEDIVSNIDTIADHIGDADEAAFAGNKLMRDAVERCLERVSEAVTRIGRTGLPLESLEPAIPWRDIRGLGNRLRHAYETIEPELIWSIIERDLAPLAQAAERLQAASRASKL